MENEEMLNNPDYQNNQGHQDYQDFQDYQNDQKTDDEALDEEKPELTTEQKKAKNRKIVTVITYSIALLCMLAGLFVPLFGTAGEGVKIIDRMYFKYVIGVFNALLFPFAKKNVINLPADGFFVPLMPFQDPTKFSSAALALTVFAIVCVLGLIMLIPVLAGNSAKRTSAVCAYAVELLALLSSGWFVFFALTEFAWGTSWIAYNFVITFCGVLLVMMIQSIYNKGGLGVTKIILFILSALIFFFLINVSILPEGAGKVFSSLSKAFGSGEAAAFVNGSLFEVGINGTEFIDLLKTPELQLMDKILCIVCGILTCMCLFNFAFDALEIVTGSKYDKEGVINDNKPMNVIAIIRYVLALLLAIGVIVLALIAKEKKPGIFLYIVTLLIAIQLIFAIVRAAVLASKRRKATQKAEDEEDAEDAPVFEEDLNLGEAEDEDEGEDTIRIETPVYEEEYVYDRTQPQQPDQDYQQPYYAQPAYEEPVYEDEQPYEDEPEYDEEPEDEEQPPYHYEPEYIYPEADEDDEDDEPVKTEERTYVYNYKAVYNGPSDDFMDTLTDAEKIEFVQVFLERRKGKIKGVPDYAIGEENKSFFPAVFIHINRAREIVSTHLLEKIYKQIGKPKS